MFTSADPAIELAQGRSGRDRPVLLATLLLLAVAARAAALWQFGGQLAADRDAYLDIAENVVFGRGFGFSPGSLNGWPTAYRPPLYPWLLAIITWCSGGDDRVVRWGIGGLHLVLGTGTVWLTVLSSRRLGLGRASLWAGAIVAVDPLLLYNTALVMTETTAAFLATLLIWTSLTFRGIRGRFFSGLVFGACCLCRPTFWMFGILIALGWLFQLWRHRRVVDGDVRGSRAEIMKSAAAALFGTALAVAPWVSRNVKEMGAPILTTTHGGYTLLLAHNPLYTKEVVNKPWGTVWEVETDAAWHNWYLSEMRRDEPAVDLLKPGKPALEIGRDRWMNRRAWRYIRDEPRTAVRSGLTLLARFWGVIPQMTTNRTIAEPVRWAIGAFNIGLFAAMLVGILRLRRDEWRDWWPLLALILAFSAVHALYWADMRMRAPLVPAIALFAARGVRKSPGDKSVAPPFRHPI